MAGLLSNPFPQFFNSAGQPYSGGFLKFYASGTATPLAVYSDSALSVSLGVSVTLNSAGRSDTVIFLQDLAYKVVLEYPAGVVIWTADPVRARDAALIVKTLTGSGSPNGTQAGTAGSAGVLPDFYWDFQNSILYVCTTTGSSSTAVWTALNASSASAAIPPPQGYLTLVSGTPVITTDSSNTALVYTPFMGSLVPIFNGASMTPVEFSELGLTLASQHLASTIYDVFAFSNSGVTTLATGPAWASSGAGAGARGTGASTTQLTRVKGLWTNAVSMTARNGVNTFTIGANLGTYLGSIFIDGSAGSVTCHRSYGQSRKWGIWNAYNRQPLFLKAGDPAASWVYTTDTFRASNNSTANSLTVFQGLSEEPYDFRFQGGATVSTFSTNIRVGIGFNSTTAASGLVGGGIPHGTIATTTAPAAFVTAPVLGINVFTALERAQASGTTTWLGGEANMLLTAAWRG